MFSREEIVSFVAGIETPLVVAPIIHLRRLVVVVISRRSTEIKPCDGRLAENRRSI